MSRIPLPPKAPGETRLESFPFLSQLAVGETLSSATASAAVYSGTDASPAAILTGVAAVAGTSVTQSVTAGTAGVIYLVTVTAITSAGQTLKVSAYLPVLDQ